MQQQEKTNILIVDDNPSKMISLESILAQRDYNIIKANSGKEALHCLLQQDVAVILLDVVMPEMDGFETARLIRSRDKNKHTPIIFITAYHETEIDRMKGYNIGAVDFLYTPIIPEILKAKVAVFVDLFRLQGQLIAANKELETFSYSVAHDLRAPLRHVAGFIGLLQGHMGETIDETSKEYLNMINTSAKRMGILISDLLAFSLVIKAAMEKDIVQTDELVSNIINELTANTDKRDIVWEIGKLPEVYADLNLLKQVFANLIGNAVKFTGKMEKAIIEIGCDESLDEFVFFVKDNGAGFDMKYIDRLFGTFQRLHSMGEFEGTGLGLAIVQRIILRHNGRVWAEGGVDEGARLWFSLPKGESNHKVHKESTKDTKNE